MYKMSKEVDKVKYPDPQFSTGDESEDIQEMNMNEISSELSYFEGRDDDFMRDSHEDGFLSMRQCQEIQAFIHKDSQNSLFDELINQSDFRNDTSEIFMDGMRNVSAEEHPEDISQSNEQQMQNYQQQNEPQNIKAQSIKPVPNLHQDLLVEENFYITLKKTVNLPKAVGKYMHKYHTRYQYSLFQGYSSFFNRINEDLSRLQEWIKKSKKNSFKLCNLMDFFNDTINKTPEECGLNRLMMRKILVRYLRKEIIPNNQVKDKKEYLVGSKVFALRCSNATLATRMQMR